MLPITLPSQYYLIYCRTRRTGDAYKSRHWLADDQVMSYAYAYIRGFWVNLNNIVDYPDIYMRMRM